jgi:hypothetical protein
MELEPRQRNALIIGALVGAVMGAGAGWLLAQPREIDPNETRQPVRPGDVFRIARNGASLLRQLDDLRHRM